MLAGGAGVAGADGARGVGPRCVQVGQRGIDGGEQVGWRRRDVGEPACDEAVLFIGARPQGLGQAGQGLAFALAVGAAAIAGGQGAQAVQVVTGADGHALGHQFAKQAVEQGWQGRGVCHRPASSVVRAL
jgi:hypothetical protein